MSRPVVFAALLLVSSLLGGCQIGTGSAGVFKPVPAPLPPSYEGEVQFENRTAGAAVPPTTGGSVQPAATPKS
jgi:hypothetical protein